MVFVNGLPLSVIELKNAADENADIWAAFNQLQTYKNDIPDLFNANVCLVISDGIYARMGSLTADEERFMRWRTIDGQTLDPLGQHQGLETLVKGIFDKEIFLNYLRYFCLFEDEKTVIKKSLVITSSMPSRRQLNLLLLPVLPTETKKAVLSGIRKARVNLLRWHVSLVV